MEMGIFGDDGDEDPSILYICSPPRERLTEWSFEENKLFENCLAEFDSNSVDFFEKISMRIVGKTIYEIKEHYEALLEDIEKIESGLVPLPDYTSLENASQADSSIALRIRRGTPWTDEEHENFLKGLETYGKGDWRSISRFSVITKTATQVASHAQKYFIRLDKLAKGGK